MSRPKITPVVNHKCILGEGPVWDHVAQRILWIDIVQGHIHQYTPAIESFKTFSIGEMIGSLALSGNYVIAAIKSGFHFVDLESEAKVYVNDPEKHIPDNRFNEGKCDPMGRFWAGSMSLSEEGTTGSVYTLLHDFSIEKKIENVTISNGMAWSADQKTFYYIDSPTLQVVSYNYDNATGSISNKKIIIALDVSEGFPDGMTIDEEGMLWIAHWGGWKVARWNPETGKKLSQIDLPVSQVTSCTFGGENFEDLYITSASIRLSAEQLEKEPLAGSLFVVKNCGYRGMPTFEFVGRPDKLTVL